MTDNVQTGKLPHIKRLCIKPIPEQKLNYTLFKMLLCVFLIILKINTCLHNFTNSIFEPHLLPLKKINVHYINGE
jgi:hypothetical protein